MKKKTLQCCRVRALFCLKQRYPLLLLLLAMLKLAHSQANGNPLQDSTLLTMSLTNVSLEKAFDIIKQQTPYRVIYDNSLLKKAKPVTVAVNKAPLLDVLALLFHSQPFEYRIIDQSIILTPQQSKAGTAYHEEGKLTPPAEDTLITGFVMADSILVPLSGATIQVKGTDISTTTDNAGRFRIRVLQQRATLIISYVEYNTKQVQVNERSRFPLNVSLTKTLGQMDEINIVSTGYESLPKERVTGSFTKVSNAMLNQQTGPFILDRLKGVASGMLFENKEDGPGYMIRGLSTIQGPKNPLIIVDNFPYEGNINNINPNDVEDITILKDAAAASIWGTRAGNGVIVITTKKGRFNQPARLSVNSNLIVVQKPDLFSLPQISSEDYVDMEQFLFSKGYYDALLNNPSYPAVTPAVEILNSERSGVITGAEAEAQLQKLKMVDTRKEYEKYFYQQAIYQQYALNITGGSNTLGYLISGGYDRNISELDAKYNRLSIRTENTYKPTRNIQINAGISFTSTNTKNGKSAYQDLLVAGRKVPYISLADAQGNALPVAQQFREGYTDTAGGGYLLNWKYYPLDDYKYLNMRTTTQSLLGTLALQYEIIKGLTIDLRYQYERQQANRENIYNINSYSTRDIINRYTIVNWDEGTVENIIPLGSVLDYSNDVVAVNNARGQITFNKTWGKHAVSTIGGGELRQIHKTEHSNTLYGYNDDILTTANLDFVNAYPNYSGGYSTIPNGLTLNDQLNNFLSVYGNAAYTYDERYIISGSLRRDASNLFGLKTNEKWTPLWSVGAGWNISKETFYAAKWLPYLKLRVTYGYSGNVDQSKSAVTTLRYTTTGLYTNFQQAVINQFTNPTLRWEKIGCFNIGLDFKTNDQLLTGSIEFYKKRGIDLFGSTLIDYTAGLATNVLIKNVANMAGKGIDITLQTKDLGRIFKWNGLLLLNYNTNKTTRYYRSGNRASIFVSNGNRISPLEGKPLYAVVSYAWGGLDPADGSPRGYLNKELSKDYNSITGTGTTLDELIYSGPALPKYFGAFINTFSWKGLSVNVNIAYKLGYYFREQSIDYSSLIFSGIGHPDYINRWQKAGDELKTSVPSFTYPLQGNRDAFYLNSTATVEKADHVRLQYINCSYSFPWLPNKVRALKSIQLYFNMANLGILWQANNKGIDPEYQSSIPPSKTFTIGFKLEF